jgi:hypothetical protein
MMATAKQRKATLKNKAKQAAAPARPPYGEIGGTGLRMLGRQIGEEYNPDLRGPKLYDQYDQMLRGDGQAQAVELAVTLPVESVKWQTVPASQDKRDLDIAADLGTNLFSGMSLSWSEFITEAVMHALIGCMFFEPCWEIRDGNTWLRKLAPRHPRTIKEYVMDPEGGLQGIVQRITNPVTNQSSDRPIPIGKLLRFTWKGTSGNPEGRGLMRPMRTHWFIKQSLYKMANIGLERFAVGTPVGTLPVGYTQSDREIYLGLLSALRTDARGALVLPPGYAKPEMLEGSGSRFPQLLAWVEYHDTLMARSALAQFLQLGSGATGSWALSDSQVMMFLLAMERIIQRIQEVIERYLIPQWVGYRYPGVDQFPTLWHTPLAHILQKAAIVELLSKLAEGQLLTHGADLEDLIRDMLGLPPTPETEPGDERETIPQDEGASRLWRRSAGPQTGASHHRPAGPTGPAGGVPGSGMPGTTRGNAADPLDRRNPPAEGAARHRLLRPRDHAHWEKTHARLGAARDEFVAAMGGHVKKQIAALVKKLRPLVSDFRSAPDLEKGTHLKRMQAIEVPLVGAYETLIGDWIRRFYTTAREEAAKAAGLTPPASISNALRTWMGTKAQVIAQKHAEGLRAGVLLQVLESVRKELPAKQLAWNLTQIGRKRASLDLADDLHAAGAELTDLLNDELAGIALPETPEAEAE